MITTEPEFIAKAKKWLEDLHNLSDGEICCRIADLLKSEAAFNTIMTEGSERLNSAHIILREFVRRWDDRGFYDTGHEDLIDQSRQLLKP